MSWDGANRSFLASALVGSLLAAYVLCGAVAGVLAPMLFARVSRDGWGTVFSLSLAPTLMLLTILAIGVARAGSVLAQQTLASHRLASRARELALAAPERLARASRVVGLDGRVALVAGAERFSFVHGLLRPRVVLSRGLLDRLSDVELQAVLEHERYHVTNLDPLKSVALRVLAAASFFVPALGELHARYAAARELAADRRAIAACGTRSLAGALLHAVHRPAWSENEVAVSLSSGQAVLRGRIEQLETGVAPAVASSVMARASLAALGSIGLLAVGLAGAVHAADFEPF
ncbi:MAG: M56 family metallopeptidase, partial [Solirubrobacteraceae bacterium]